MIDTSDTTTAAVKKAR